MTTAVVGLILKTQLASTQTLTEFTRVFPAARKWYMCITSGAGESQVGELAQQLCVWMKREGIGQRVCKKLMASKFFKAILDKKGKNIIEMNCALLCQVDGKRHTEKRWAWGANILSDSALEDTYICSGLQSLLRIGCTPATFCIFPTFFSWRGDSFHSLPFAKAVINLLSLVIDLAQSVRESSLALNCMHHKLSP